MTTGHIYFSTLTGECSQINGAFLFGESIFTSTRIKDGKIKFKEFHLLRLKKGVEFLFDYKESTLFELLSRRLIDLEKSDSISSFNYLRLTFFNDLDGKLHFNIFLNNKVISSSAIKVISQKTPFNEFFPSFVKVGNYILQNKIKKTYGEVLFIDNDSNTLELSTSNIFVLDKGVIKTPPIMNGVLDGIYRANIIQVCNDLNIAYKEEHLKISNLLDASMVFCSNSFLGIRVIEELDGYKLMQNDETKLIDIIKDRLGF